MVDIGTWLFGALTGNYDRNHNKHLALNGELFTHSSYKAMIGKARMFPHGKLVLNSNLQTVYIKKLYTKTQSAGVAKCETAWRCDTEAGSVRDHPPEIGTGYIPDATPTISPQREQTACRGESRAEKSAAVQIQYLPL